MSGNMLKRMIGASAGDLGKVLETLISNQDETNDLLQKILSEIKDERKNKESNQLVENTS